MRPVIDALVYDGMVKISKDIFNAAQSGDVELAIATLGRTQLLTAYYIEQLKEGYNNGTNL
jgi:hypothetical protein